MSAGAASIPLEAEWEVLGALMADNNFYRFVRGLLPADFGDPLNGLIFDEIEMAIIHGELADAVTLAPRLTEMGVMSKEDCRRYVCCATPCSGAARFPRFRVPHAQVRRS